MLGCELYDDGTTRRYWQDGYDGKDFIVYDEKTQTWTAAAPQAVGTKLRWEANPVSKQYIMDLFEQDCVDWLKNYIQNGIVKRKVPPEVRLFQKKAGHSAGSGVTCHVTGFYPREVEVIWLRDGQGPLEEGVWSGEVLPNMDGTYQVRKTLSVNPEEQKRHRYTCLVDHASLGEKIEKEWVPETGLHLGLIAGVVVGVLVLIAVIAGLVIWKKRQAGKDQSEVSSNSSNSS
ncbi:Major histocompatibility complex class I-related gene protein [Acipenser ruthenus]|uniref:Major histocompatibility complex class I-related gene protein n=1 Tax=Acipenser ruthenus TaxID=7906 RepID=A0A444UTX8_ACIRT|nr:Major histocompatibility complex class I-related gene protein [Acipenser ruthenus]